MVNFFNRKNWVGREQEGDFAFGCVKQINRYFEAKKGVLKEGYARIVVF
jgi:hypothetical protein